LYNRNRDYGFICSSGENRAKEAIIAALDSPLLNDNKITVVPKTYCCLSFLVSNEITIDEIGEINDHIQNEDNANIIMGVGEDDFLVMPLQ
jgi:cell division protein FtsZ